MKKTALLIISTLIISIITACAPAAPAAPAVPTSLASEYLSIEYADAANLRSQLAFGTLQLAGTPNAISPDQAKGLTPLWQAILTMSGDSTTAPEELTAVQDQITSAMTPDQLKAIAAMQITAWFAGTYKNVHDFRSCSGELYSSTRIMI